MHELRVTIARFVDTRNPGWVECEFVDAHGARHVVRDKAPYFTSEDLWTDSAYPLPGVIHCEVLRTSSDGGLVTISIAPSGCESLEAISTFEVRVDQLSERPDSD